MCGCNQTSLRDDVFENQRTKVIEPLPPRMSGLGGINVNFDLVNVALWFAMFYAGHKFGKKVFGK